MNVPEVRTGRLDVFLLNRRAGSLDYVSRQNEMHFRYDPAYIAAPDAIPLSQSLPLGTEPFDTDKGAIAERAVFGTKMCRTARRSVPTTHHLKIQ